MAKFHRALKDESVQKHRLRRGHHERMIADKQDLRQEEPTPHFPAEQKSCTFTQLEDARERVRLI
ncbi:hypothetical protein BHE74_00025179, partial [Ensete ventricosum]